MVYILCVLYNVYLHTKTISHIRNTLIPSSSNCKWSMFCVYYNVSLHTKTIFHFQNTLISSLSKCKWSIFCVCHIMFSFIQKQFPTFRTPSFLLHPNVNGLYAVCFIWASTRENLSSEVCEQHRCRPACTSPQTDQHLCYSLFGTYHI